MKKAIGSTSVDLMVVIFGIAVAVAGVGGWIWNIVKIFATVADPIGGMFILRCIGIFVAPLGAVLGFL